MDGVPLDGDLFRKLLLTNALVFPFAIFACAASGGSSCSLDVAGRLDAALSARGRNPRHGAPAPGRGDVGRGAGEVLPSPTAADWRLGRAARRLAGLLVAGGIGWLWTGAVSYIPTPLGPGAILAYDEFRDWPPKSSERADLGDTLFVLPETDSTPQLHPLTGLPPPGLWVKGWRWYFKPARVLSTLGAQWENKPPDWIIVFPELTAAGEPGIKRLLEFVDARYERAFESAAIYDHGRALAYQLSGET